MGHILSGKVGFLLVALAIVLLPWLLWRVSAVRRFAPLAVLQILAGVALGPSLLGRFAPELHAALFTPAVLSACSGVSNLGVLLYVFVTGLHLDPALLRRDAGRLAPIALGSVALPFAMGLGAGWWMLTVPGAAGPAGGAGLIVGVAICIAVTALPVLAAVLGELGLLGQRIGQTALALAALNDAALWIGLASLLALTGATGGLLRLAVAAMWFGMLLGAVRPVLHRFAPAGEHAVLVVGCALAILSACVSEALGTGYLIGAFAAGAIMPPACRPALLLRLETVTASVLLPFFFAITGLQALIQPESASFLTVLLVAVATTVFGKLAGTALPARVLGYSWADCVALGAMMQTKGLMEVVVLAVLHDAGLLGDAIFSAMVGMAVICTVLTAPAVRLCLRLDRPAHGTDRVHVGLG